MNNNIKGKLYVVGMGSGEYEDQTVRALNILNRVDYIYCDELMYEKLNYVKPSNKIIKNSYFETSSRCNNAIDCAVHGNNVAILGSGDTGIYGIASIILERTEDLMDKIDVEIIPGITYAITGAAFIGSPLTKDFAIITLSDNLSDKKTLFDKIETLAVSDLSIVFYSVCNPTKDNLIKAREILMKYRNPITSVGITSNLGNEQKEIIISNLLDFPFDKINSYSTVFVGNSKTRVLKNNKIITPL